jgi:hypothetical protein
MSNITTEKPANMLQEHLDYLVTLRDSGDTNMWGADTYLRAAYPLLSQRDSRDILFYWMDTCHE